MSPKLKSLQERLRSKGRFLLLLYLILGLLVLGPILEQFVAIRLILDIFLTAIALSMVSIIRHKKRLIRIASVMAMVMIISLWLKYFYQYDMFDAVSMIIGVLITLIVTANTLTFMVKHDTVDREVIFAAMVVYLLMAQIWAFVYVFLEQIHPASFNLPQGQGDLLTFEYFSLVTITTLGFGDISPVSRMAKAITVFEAVVGQLYLVVVIAWFVGMHVSGKSK